MIIEYQNYQNEFKTLVNNKKSFEICGVPTDEMLNVCNVLENYIELNYFTCRIYTKKRIITGLAGVINPAWAVLSLATIAAHNLATYNPDYEIGRDIANNRISVEYKKLH